MKKYCTNKRAWKQHKFDINETNVCWRDNHTPIFSFLFFLYTPIFSHKEAMSRLSYFIALLPKLVLGAAVLASHVRVVGF